MLDSVSRSLLSWTKLGDIFDAKSEVAPRKPTQIKCCTASNTRFIYCMRLYESLPLKSRGERRDSGKYFVLVEMAYHEAFKLLS